MKTGYNQLNYQILLKIIRKDKKKKIYKCKISNINKQFNFIYIFKYIKIYFYAIILKIMKRISQLND